MLANFKDRMDVAFQQMDRTLPAVDYTDRDGDPAIRILIVNGHELMNPHEILVHFIATQFITLDPFNAQPENMPQKDVDMAKKSPQKTP